MDTQTAKQIPILDFLHKLDMQPTKCSRGRYWFRSPFRQEKTPSFVLSPDTRAWFDHGEGVGGNIIDLAMRLVNCQDVSTALAYIETITDPTNYNIPPIQLPAISSPEPAYKLVAETPFLDSNTPTRTSVARYLKDVRGIDPGQLAPYLWEVTFTDTFGREQNGFGLKNGSGGHELRQAPDWKKVVVGHKDISIYRARQDNAPWYSFEGLPDFGTFLTIRQPPVGACNFIVLNGTGLTSQAITYLAQQPSGVLYLCLQQGSSGQVSGDKLRDFVKQTGWAGGEITYPAHFEDYNAWWQAERGLALQGVVVRPTIPPLRQTPRLGV